MAGLEVRIEGSVTSSSFDDENTGPIALRGNLCNPGGTPTVSTHWKTRHHMNE